MEHERVGFEMLLIELVEILVGCVYISIAQIVLLRRV